MKRAFLFLLFAFLLLGFTGCSSTRKATKSTTDSHLTATQEEERRTDERQMAAITSNTEINDRTNVVIEFTKVEYNDGSTDITATSPGQLTGETSTRNMESKSKPPDKASGIKSITTGKITINGDTEAKTETTVTEESGKTTDERINAGIQADQKQEGTTEETKKPKCSLFYWAFGIFAFTAISVGVVYGIRYFKRLWKDN